MKIDSKKIIIVLLACLGYIQLHAQEYIIDCGNPLLQEYSKNYFKNNFSKNLIMDTLALPFFDDFSYSYIYPDSSKWIDKFTFINNDFAIDPVSIGVATFDALNEHGHVYPHLSSSISSMADFLTSKPIDLAVQKSDSVYLSFFYQAGGLGNTPEYKDSLVLQFKTPVTDWHSVWKKEGGVNSNKFQVVLIPIIDTTYLKKGFQFRFVNYVSVSSNYEPSWISNSDIWNIDFVKLDVARSCNDTTAEDVAFVKNFTSLIKDFEAVPWEHFKGQSQNSFLNDSLCFIYKNNFKTQQQNVFRHAAIINAYSNDTVVVITNDNENINPSEIVSYKRKITYNFVSNTEDSAKFIIKGHLITDNLPERYMYRWNDTIRYTQKFSNYYAYDDGTAEKGYGISGQNTAYASLAYQFKPMIGDTLRGVYIFFNHVLNEGNKKYFFLNVWKDRNGKPGDTIYQKIGEQPSYSNQLNGFIYYPLDTAIYIDNTFYIGWTKTTDDMLNCGFDLNRKANKHLFINTSGEWRQSEIEGALMIRPVFSRQAITPNNVNNYKLSNPDFSLYPNPCNEYVNINLTQNIDNYTINIYDITGKLVLSAINKDHIDLSELLSGIYFVQLKSNDFLSKTQKLLITK